LPAKSHVDLCLFIQILEVDEDKIPVELGDALASRDRSKIEQTITSLVNQRKADARYMFVSDSTNLHESIHLVQAVVYPFLRWYAMASFQHVMDSFKELEPFGPLVQSGTIGSLVSPSFMLLDVEHYIWDLSTKTWFGKVKPAIGLSFSEQLPPNTKAKPLVRLNTTDLIENAASLIQFKMSTGIDFPTWKEFSRWSKRNPSYTGIIEFVAKHLGDADLALRVFSALIQVAFETNRPVQAFAILLGALDINLRGGSLKPIVSQPEPCRWIEIFDTFLDKAPLEEPEYGDLISKRFFRLDRFNTSHMRYGGKLSHPIIGEFARRWGVLERDDIAYRYAFTAPNGYKRQIKTIEELFHSPITVLKFTTKGENLVLVTGDLSSTGLANMEDVHLEERDIKASFVDFLAIYGVVRRSFNALMDNDFRLCHHKDCPAYEANLCNTWIFIPKRYQDCTFQQRLEYLRKSYAENAVKFGSKSRVRMVLFVEGKDG
jgi:hypothetical protein